LCEWRRTALVKQARDRRAREWLTASVVASSELLNSCDVAIIQHEYGITEVPTATRCWTSSTACTSFDRDRPHDSRRPTPPSGRPRGCRCDADHVVVMSGAARARLCTLFDIDPIVTIIPHGRRSDWSCATPVSADDLDLRLIDGKGIER